jgi:sugar phosphate isomerase/epimerase
MQPRRPRLGVSPLVTQSASILRDIDLAADAGFDAISVGAPDVDELGIEALSRALDARGLSVSSYRTGSGLREELRSATRDATQRYIAEAAALRAPVVVATVKRPDGATIHESDRLWRQYLEEVGPAARDLGTTIGLEPVHPILTSIGYAHTLTHARRLVDELPGASLIVDLAHLWWDADLIETFEACVDRVSLVQYTGISSAALSERRYQRDVPWSGTFPAAELLRAFRRSGFDGVFEDECHEPGAPRSSDYLRRSVEWAKAVIDAP